MADPVSEALVSLMRGDATLATLLQGNTYAGVTPIFSTDPVPDDAELPYVQTPGQTFDNRNLNLDGRFREINRPIRVYFSRDGDAGPIEDAASRIRDLITDQTLSVAGYRTVFVDPQGPLVQDPDEDSYGRTINFTIWLYPL